MNEEVKVSVCVVTYNQEKYIAECIDSIIKQKCSFKYEILISDDASTDKTPEIIKRYKDNYPELIKVKCRGDNVGPTRNILELYSIASGQYISHVDGDDLLFEDKLQKQADLLDSNPGCFISSHAVLKVDDKSISTGNKSGDKINGIKDYYYLVENLPFFAHSSKMFRNNKIYIKVSDEIFDFELHLIHAKNGDIIHTNEILGAYRVGVGVATGSGRLNEKMVSAKFKVYDSILLDADHTYHSKIKKSYSKSALNYAVFSYCMQDFEFFNSCINKSISIDLLGFKQMFFYFLKFIPSAVNKKISPHMNRVFLK